MREILFRGKAINGSGWLYGDLMDYGGSAQIWYLDDREKWNALIDPSTVGEYTGLTGKNGTKIFEGDILVFIDPDTQEFDDNERFVVRWFEDFAGFFLERFYNGRCPQWKGIDKIHSANFKVIGNVYDNPELLRRAEHE